MKKEEKKELKKQKKEEKKEIKRLKKEEKIENKKKKKELKKNKKTNKIEDTTTTNDDNKKVKYVFKFSIFNLLAVLVIIAILIVNILPSVSKKFSNQNKLSFVSEIKKIYEEGNKRWEKDSAIKMDSKIYSFVNSNKLVCNEVEYKSIPMSIRSNINYIISFTKEGKVDKYYISDGVYEFKYEGEEFIFDEETIKKQIKESKTITFDCNILEKTEEE